MNEGRQRVTDDDFICNKCSHRKVCYMSADLKRLNSTFMIWIKDNNVPSFRGEIGLDVKCKDFDNEERVNIKNEFKNCN